MKNLIVVLIACTAILASCSNPQETPLVEPLALPTQNSSSLPRLFTNAKGETFLSWVERNPEKVAKCIESLKNSCSLPITIKHRIGVDEDDSFSNLNNFVRHIANAGADRFTVHARKAILKGLNPKQNRKIPPLKYDVVKKLKILNPGLLIEINGGFTNIDESIDALNDFDGVMIGRSVYKHPLRWSEIDQKIYGLHAKSKSASNIIFSLIPYIEEHLSNGGKSWDICKHLINLVEGIPKAKIWRNQISSKSIKKELSIDYLLELTYRLKEIGY